MLMLERQKIASGFFLFKAEQKAKNKKKKRQQKLLQTAENLKTTSYSSSGHTTNTYEEK